MQSFRPAIVQTFQMSTSNRPSTTDSPAQVQNFGLFICNNFWYCSKSIFTPRQVNLLPLSQANLNQPNNKNIDALRHSRMYSSWHNNNSHMFTNLKFFWQILYHITIRYWIFTIIDCLSQTTSYIYIIYTQLHPTASDCRCTGGCHDIDIHFLYTDHRLIVSHSSTHLYSNTWI